MQKVDLAFSLDTTGSMYPCLGQVRRRVQDITHQLAGDIPGIRFGMIAHGDYCDAKTAYVTKVFPLSRDADRFTQFVGSVKATNGGDSPECYELVLHEARSLGWSADAAKAFVLIGDDEPHDEYDPQNSKRLNWLNEAKLLQQLGVPVFTVQALNRGYANSFYRSVAEATGGVHLTLDQFSIVPDLIMAIAYHQAGGDSFREFEREVYASGRMNRNLDDAFQALSGRGTKRTRRITKSPALESVPIGRFQILFVDRDQPIKQFVQEQGLIFEKGRGFYEYTKTETVQDYKEVILRDDETGDLFTGERARVLMGLPRTGTVRGKFTVPKGFTAFVQSTSVNRKLIGGTEFLYEVDLSR